MVKVSNTNFKNSWNMVPFINKETRLMSNAAIRSVFETLSNVCDGAFL